MHQILPIVIPCEFVVLICVTSFVGYLLYQEIIKAFRQRLSTGVEQVYPTYSVIQEAQGIAEQAWTHVSDQQPDAASV
jgi:hypothetical protein